MSPSLKRSRYSSSSVSLMFVCVSLSHDCAAQEQIPQGELRYFATTGAYGNKCVARTLCEMNFGLDGCAQSVRFALPAFETPSECLNAFSRTKLSGVTCANANFGQSAVLQCDMKKVTVKVEHEDYDENDEPVTTQSDEEIETAECRTVVGEKVLATFYVPVSAGDEKDGDADLYRKTAGWYGGIQNPKSLVASQSFELTADAKIVNNFDDSKVKGYFVQGKLAPPSGSQKKLDRALLACDVATNPTLAAELGTLKSGGNPPGSGTNGMNGSSNSYHAGGGSGVGNFMMWYLLWNSIRPGFSAPGYFGSGGQPAMGFAGGPSFFRNTAQTGTGTSFVSRAPDGKMSNLNSDSVRAAQQNHSAVTQANAAPGSKPVVKSSNANPTSGKSFTRPSSMRSGGFGSSGRNFSSGG